ncbi:MAG: hypothetical protein ACPGXZ_06610 [Saprospiraceae bacterium]
MSDKQKEIVAMLHLVSAASLAISNCIANNSLSQEPKRKLKNAQKSLDLFLKSYEKKTNAEAGTALDEQGATLYQMAIDKVPINYMFVDEFMSDYSKLVEAYVKAMKEARANQISTPSQMAA